jgi:3-methyladenine DNA glycosylase AlkD
MSSNDLAQQLRTFLGTCENVEKARAMAAYMRDKFAFFGIQSAQRRQLLRDFLKSQGGLTHEYYADFVHACWQLPERELHYCAQDVAAKYAKRESLAVLSLYETMLSQNQWWDTIDFIASNLLGSLYLRFATPMSDVALRLVASPDIWLQRSAILMQLKARQNTNTDLLLQLIELSRPQHNEFFIAKAIGWALREYSKTDCHWVLTVLEKTTLPALSQREARKAMLRMKT